MLDKERIKKSVTLKEEIDELKEILTKKKKDLAAINYDIAAEMIDQNVTKISVDGVTVYVKTESWFKVINGDQSLLVKAYRDNGLSDCVKETVNWKTMNSEVIDQSEKNLEKNGVYRPYKWLQDVIEGDFRQTAGFRKSAKKIPVKE